MRDNPPAVDVVFDISGFRVTVDYAGPLATAVGRALRWFEAESGAGIHPLRAATTTQGMLVLARRAKLLLRVPASRTRDVLALSGCAMDIAGELVGVQGGVLRALTPSATLYAHRVTTGAGDAQSFHEDIERRLAELGVRCEFIAGRARPLTVEGATVAGYGLALHGLAAIDSLRVQSEGIGGGRRHGCGIFVPHKAIATAA